MSTFGAVDLSTLVPSSGRDQTGATGPGGAPGAAGAAPAGAPGAAGEAPVAGPEVSGPVVVDVDASSLRDLVERSAQVPVIVLLSTASVEGSTGLGADMEAVAQENGGAFQLARVDVERSPEIAQAFQVQAIPAVMAVLAGQPVPLFQGAAPVEQIRQVVAQVLLTRSEVLDRHRYANSRNTFMELLKQGVIVRPVGSYGLPQWLRISIGLPQENAIFIAALTKALA